MSHEAQVPQSVLSGPASQSSQSASEPASKSAQSTPQSAPTRCSKPRRRHPVSLHKTYGIVFYDDWLLEKAIKMFGAAEVEVDPEPMHDGEDQPVRVCLA
ncbi:hypothetical protein A0H81_05596 [Grifola frondosa]|uniref:Uncharacterized protein n=1 Tax=Grifola frondosa TaxID=5627 RepID=A0A1C7MBI9_GRIFR|nr:hypothetical protein A0H81_05596 [Grifola frondosa]